MRHHLLNRCTEVAERQHVSNRREQTGDDVETAAEIERAHVTVVDRDTVETVSCDRTKAGVRLDALDAQVAAQVRQMQAGAACHIEQALSVGDMLSSQSKQGRCFVGV